MPKLPQKKQSWSHLCLPSILPLLPILNQLKRMQIAVEGPTETTRRTSIHPKLRNIERPPQNTPALALQDIHTVDLDDLAGARRVDSLRARRAA